MKIGIFLLALFFCQSLLSQTEDRFDLASFNKNYLEHLVKTRVDAVRGKHDCKPLVNDSILYVASDHHAQYMLRKGRLTHKEVDSVQTKTPQLRAEYFGAENYHVGENVLFVPYNSKVKNKKGKKFDTHTYQGIADAMVDSWVNSPGHFKNIITEDYQITGLSVSVDPKKGRIYACQKFAKVDFQFHFEENKEFFNYSEYVPPPIISSFDGIPDELIDYKYPYKLRHDKLEKCTTCESLESEKPHITLRVERNKFILKVENSEYVRKLIRDRRDGFAVEIVTYDDYMCGNPEYYTKPSRRNEQLKLNGFTLEPLYRKQLFKGYKKRKRKKDVKFLQYIFRKDSVSFFRRFGQYKADKYNSKYFEITLGKIPKGVSYWNHNLVYIQNKQICDIDYFTSFCGDIFQYFKPTVCLPAYSKFSYKFEPQKKVSNFTIPFLQGQMMFTNADIEPFISSMGELKYNIDSIEIHAYASIEGDSIINERLQQQRAQNISDLIQSRQAKSFKLSILTSTDWYGFTKNASKSSRWKFLASKSSEELAEYLKSTDPIELEPLLAPTRRGDIRIYATIPIEIENYAYMIKKENEALLSQFDTETHPNKIAGLYYKLESLYETAHYLAFRDLIPVEVLAKFKLPERSISSAKLYQLFILYGNQFDEEFTEFNPNWPKRKISDLEWLLKSRQQIDQYHSRFLYTAVWIKTEILTKKRPLSQRDVQEVINMMDHLKNSYSADSSIQKSIDRINFNLNVLLLNEVFTQSPDPLESGHDASKSIAQVFEYFLKYDEMTDSIAIALARCAVHYSEINGAVRMLEPYATTDDALAYLMQLSWNHSSEEQWANYYTHLIELSYTMNIDTWCNMFMGNCQIPFQAFDHEALRNRFCEECMERNKVILDMKKSSN